MPNTDNVTTGKPKITGAIYRAPLGTTLPTDATTALSGAFVEMGYISDDGVTNSNTPSTTKIKAWGGQIVLIVTSEKPDTFKLKFIEALNSNVLETVYGEDNVTVDAVNGTIAVKANAAALDDYVYVIEEALKGGAKKRIVIPCGELSALGDIVYKDDTAIGYDVTLDALPNSSGDNHYEYIALPAGTTMALSLDKSTASVAHGSTTTITATTTPAGMRVTWGTSDATKATVNDAGVVTGVAAGSATITATFGGISKSCTVTVT